jgi:MFS transporter, DHA3 family, tetracycline resistance protein
LLSIVDRQSIIDLWSLGTRKVCAVNKLAPPLFYLVGEGLFAVVGSMAWVVLPVYYVLTVHMNPLKLLLVGSIFELAIFVFDVPTGLFADVYSRRRSVIAGWFLGGCTLILQGLVPLFSVIAAVQVIEGLADTFVHGAWVAWLRDETGEERFGTLLARGAQVRQIGSLLGTVGGALLATINLQFPIVLAGALSCALALLAIAVMPEQGFKPVRASQRARRQAMVATWRTSVGLVRASRLMLVILGIAALFGAFTEGMDRLGQAHFLLDIGLPPAIDLPPFAGLKPVAWFGVIGGGGLVLGAGAMEVLRRRVDLRSRQSVARALFLANACIILSVLTFALAGNFVLALCAYWGWSILRSMVDLLSTVWLNQNIADGEARATVLSMSGQANAFGEWGGGPVIGLVGTIFSIRAALAVGALMLSPALVLYGWAVRRGGSDAPP